MTGGLIDRYDLTVFDLDGVVYLGEQPVPGAPEAIGRLHAEGRAVAYATNNASRRPDEVAALLNRLGVPATTGEVVTSAQVAAAMAAGCFPPGAPTLVVGSPALRDEVRAAGLTPVDSATARPVAVVQGYGREVGWAQLAEACLAICAGAHWIATNTDRTLPSPRGPLPGNGAMVAAVATAVDREPDGVAGKPQPGLFQRAAARTGARRVLVVGDRLDTDVEGAQRAGMDSMLVLTGVATPRDVLLAPAQRRPTYVAGGLDALFEPAAAPLGEPVGTGGWRVRREDGVLVLEGGSSHDAGGTPMEALRALCAVGWNGQPPVKVTAGSALAAETLRRLHLADITPG